MTSAAQLRALDRVRATYESDGYEVTIEERLPDPYQHLVADAIARKQDETILIEVRPVNMSESVRRRLSRLAEFVRTLDGWRVDVVTYEPEAQPFSPASDDVLRRIEEARRVADISPDAAVLLTWSALEGALLRFAERSGQGRERAVPPRSLIRELVIAGLLSDTQAERLDALARLRNQVAHGGAPDASADIDLDWALQFTRETLDGHVTTVDDMIEWFHTNYESPDDAALPYDGEEGGYVWFGQGPHHADDALAAHFDTALEEDIAEATSVIERDGIEWAERGQR